MHQLLKEKQVLYLFSQATLTSLMNSMIYDTLIWYIVYNKSVDILFQRTIYLFHRSTWRYECFEAFLIG